MDTLGVDEDSDELDAEELTEPKFKYKRLLNDLKKIFQKDAASCIAVNTKFLALGTQWGCIYLLDHSGNNIMQDRVIISSPHSAAVNQISIDDAGEYIGSCSNDGKLNIYGLWSSEFSQVLSMDRPIRSVALHPEFSKASSGQQFVTGDRCLILHERGLFTRDKQHVIYAGKDRDGHIHNVAWYKDFIAFANDTGVRVYDRESRTLVTHISRRHDITLRCDLYPSHLVWRRDAEDTLIISWAGTVTVCEIKTAARPLDSSNSSRRYGEIRNMWDLEPGYFVCGISWTEPLGYLVAFVVRQQVRGTEQDNNLDGQDGLLGQPGDRLIGAQDIIDGDEELDGRGDAMEDDNHPRVLLLEPCGLQDYEKLTEDIIVINNDQTSLCHQYNLVGLPDENLFFIVAQREIILIRPCNADDHVEWLLENGLFAKALSFTKTAGEEVQRYTAVDVGRRYLDALIDDGEYSEAASLCPEVCEKRKDVWEEYVTRFDGLGQLEHIADYLPLKNPQLEPECYEAVLLHYLSENIIGFKKLISKWSADLYRVSAIIKETLDRLYQQRSESGNIAPGEHQELLETLALLYTYERNYERALTLYMKLRNKAVFSLIQRFRLFPAVKNSIQDLMAIDRDLAVRLLLDNEDSLPPQTVINQLSRQPELQLAYLDRLFTRGEGADFADLAITLYAEHNRPRLLRFLRDCEYYSLDKALEICQARKLLPETVFLLARSGDRREALRVIIRESGDIIQAIEFCKEHDDHDLWQDLIAHSVSQAGFVRILMENIGTHVDPILLIKAIPPAMSIPGLRNALVKILADYNMQISLQDGCCRVLTHDAHELMSRWVGVQRRAVRVARDQICESCARPLLRLDPRFSMPIQVFRCGHSFHEACLASGTGVSGSVSSPTPPGTSSSSSSARGTSIAGRACPLCSRVEKKRFGA